jgi:hypothetical protein
VQVKDQTWLILREEGMVVEEALDDEDDGHDTDYDEKNGIVEKISAGAQAAQEEKGSGPWTTEPDVASLHIT